MDQWVERLVGRRLGWVDGWLKELEKVRLAAGLIVLHI
jgi:hypothetical protein